MTTILFYPQYPHPRAVLYQICQRLGYQVDINPNQLFDLAIFWKDCTFREPDKTIEAIAKSRKVLNIKCQDISKKYIDAAKRTSFGYSLAIDPSSHVGPLVSKSDLNARHDGEIVHGPVASIDPKRVYQRLVDNRVDTHTVEDLRVPVFCRELLFAYRKLRSISKRFQNGNTSVKIEEINNVLDSDEQARILTFCELCGLEYGELDILRDRSDGRLYIVDANCTPFGPPNPLSTSDSDDVMKRMAARFSNIVAQCRGI